MDIHSTFDDAHVKRLKKVVAKFDIEEKEESNWELFADFLRDMVKENFSRFNYAIIRIITDPFEENLQTPETIKQLFGYLTNDEYELKTIKYTKDSDLITVDYNEIKDEI